MRASARSEFAKEQKLVDYLLGRLGEDERATIESRLFAEEDLNDELLATVDDLIHAYIAGALGPDDRARVETELLTSARHRERLEFIRATMSVTERVPLTGTDGAEERASARRRAWALRAAAAAIALLVAGSLHRFSAPPPSDGPGPAPSAPASAAAEDGTPRPRPDEGEVRTIRVPANTDAPLAVRVAASTRVVRLLLKLPERPSYDAVVRAANGATVWRALGIPPVETDERVVLTIPARVLTAGRYTLRIEGESLRDTPATALVTEYRLDVMQ